MSQNAKDAAATDYAWPRPQICAEGVRSPNINPCQCSHLIQTRGVQQSKNSQTGKLRRQVDLRRRVVLVSMQFEGFFGSLFCVSSSAGQYPGFRSLLGPVQQPYLCCLWELHLVS